MRSPTEVFGTEDIRGDLLGQNSSAIYLHSRFSLDKAMADVLTPQQRSFNMSRIKSRDTKPETIVRSIIHRLGYRYRLHKSDLPGKPDIVLVRHRKIIDVHGCFFHMHKCKYSSVVPATNAKFWKTKGLSNVKRDGRNLVALCREVWRGMSV